jgi:hypothetical protein
MLNMDYCCATFEVASNQPKESSPNIRIVKFVSERVINPPSVFDAGNGRTIPNTSDVRGQYRFYMTCGYTQFSIQYVPYFPLKFCPFCGVDLFAFYKADGYGSEVEGETFPLEFPKKP